MLSYENREALDFFYEHLGRHFMAHAAKPVNVIHGATCAQTGIVGDCVEEASGHWMRCVQSKALSITTPLLGPKSPGKKPSDDFSYNNFNLGMYALVTERPETTIVWVGPGCLFPKGTEVSGEALRDWADHWESPNGAFRVRVGVKPGTTGLTKSAAKGADAEKGDKKAYPVALAREIYSGKVEIVEDGGFAAFVARLNLGEERIEGRFLLVDGGRAYGNLIRNLSLSVPGTIKRCSSGGVALIESVTAQRCMNAYAELSSDERALIRSLYKGSNRRAQRAALSNDTTVAWLNSLPAHPQTRAAITSAVAQSA